MGLHRHERISLVLEAIITAGICIFLYLSIFLLFVEFLQQPMTWLGEPNIIAYDYFHWTPERFIATRVIFSIFMLIVGIFMTIIRVKKKYDALKLNHVLAYLKYISKGHYDIRIPEIELGEFTEVIPSINTLVDSTTKAMEEERKIEQTKDELIANVGHDLRTPLTSIIGYLGLIENQRYQSIEELLSFTHTAYHKAISMQNLVNDLFDYAASRLTSYEITPIKLQILLMFNQLAADFQESAAEKSIRIEVDVQPEDLLVVVDPDKMARVFNNLITNAIKYGHGANVIRLVAYESIDKSKYFMEVSNDGELVKEDELEKIFQRSYRADSARSFDVPGTGLGLAIVRNIIELHGGRVYAIIEGNQLIFRMEMNRVM